jgi:AAA+ ATPase superfamily predicted ATPase
MDAIKNPFSPGAGSPPPELVGREGILEQARILLGRIKAKRPEKSILFTGLRGVGKTVLLNEIERMAAKAGYRTVSSEAHEDKSLAAIGGFNFRVWSLLLFGRFFAQRVCGFFSAGRRGDELHAAGGSFALALADEIEELLQVVTGLARQVVARLADFSQDGIWFHGSRFQQIERGANRGA